MKTNNYNNQWGPCQENGNYEEKNKLAKLRRHASQVHFAKIHLG